ncbi:MAG TPA: hypothetical protein VLN49_22745 [Gemmatimonadaceae bacterium]|nr:hypothetical protein [Gemmatimonadaceae bacterium]
MVGHNDRRPLALGISPHTGWAACVVVGGSPRKPEIVANAVIDVLGDDERFCFHMAAEMELPKVRPWLTRLRKKALANARRALAPLITAEVIGGAVVATDRDPGPLDAILAAHPRIHTAEGCFYRDVFRDACSVPVHLVPPKSLDAARIGKFATKPWGRDQRLAALAAFSLLDR